MNRENLNFPTELFSAEKSDIISVKRKTLRSFPKSATPTSFNLDIPRLKPKFEILPPSREKQI